ncbi:MAG TPA: hypothetical protein VNA44_10385 [Burkholderiaceae bacterium]|nr:hypothetical protein [Burkholderiaceae bacterium]
MTAEKRAQQAVPSIRIDVRNDLPVNVSGQFILYWMIMHRRRRYNFGLQRAVELALESGKPLVVFEALRCGYRWANDRIHGFVLQGMEGNARTFADAPVTYFPYVEPEAGAGKGLLAALAARASAVVTDAFPCFMLPQMVTAASKQIRTRFEVVDSNGLAPLAAADKAYGRAVDFRRFLQKVLPDHLQHVPAADPLQDVQLPSLGKFPEAITARWPKATAAMLSSTRAALAMLPIDHGVGPAVFDGGSDAAMKRLDLFVRKRLAQYAEDRSDPDLDGTSCMSPYLHFGHISVHEIFARIAKKESWSLTDLNAAPSGKREGWWGMSTAAEAYLDELVTWRELAYNLCDQCPDTYSTYECVPEWARRTLEQHASDERPYRYSIDELEAAATHDPVWNAAHTQLVRDGWFHNSMRILWAKKILEWSAHPREALATMIHLMNKYAVDGRNPNSYAGFLWTLGRYDRPWFDRPIFGTVRYVSSENTVRKRRLTGYLKKYSALPFSLTTD